MIIRMATKSDEESMTKLFRVSYVTNRSVYKPKKTARSIGSDTNTHYEKIVADKDGAIIGMAWFWIENNKINLGRVCTHPEHRRNGILRSLIQFIENYARVHSLPIIQAKTIKETGNSEIYQKIGFQLDQEYVAEWAIGENDSQVHESVMVKNVLQ